MKSPLLRLALGLAAISAAVASAQVPQLLTYQGRIQLGTNNFDGVGHFKFALVAGTGNVTLWSNDGTSGNGNQPVAAVSIPVVKGFYSLLLGDTDLANMTPISPGVFNNSNVRVRVWFSDGVNAFEHLQPDQRIAAVGYAIMAANVPDASIGSAKIAPGAVTSSHLADGSVTSAKLASSSVTAVHLDSALSESVWKTHGNAGGFGAFLGTTNNTSLELRQNNTVALRLDGGGPSSSANVIGGSAENRVWWPTYSATVFGGGPTPNSANLVGAESVGATISGGRGNRIGSVSPDAIIGGGIDNRIWDENHDSTIGGGAGNMIDTNSLRSTISGGMGNWVRTNSQSSTIGGGENNRAGKNYATVPGGYQNEANGAYSFAAGRQAKANHQGSFVWADSWGTDFTSQGNDSFAVRALGGFKFYTSPTGLPLLSLSEASHTVYVEGALKAKNMPFVKYVKEKIPYIPIACDGEGNLIDFTIFEMTVDIPADGILVVRGHAQVDGVAAAGGGCWHGGSWFPSPFPSREDTMGGRFGLTLQRIDPPNTAVELSASGREFHPDVFRGAMALRVNVSSVEVVSPGQVRLRLLGWLQSAAGIGERSPEAMFFPARFQ